MKPGWHALVLVGMRLPNNDASASNIPKPGIFLVALYGHLLLVPLFFGQEQSSPTATR